MSGISTGIGLVSGINSGDIIQQLVQLERRPIQTLQGRIAQASRTQLAFTELSTKLNALKNSGEALRKPSTFDQTAATSSDEAVVTAKAAPGTAAGAYQFRVARLVSGQQLVSRGGFATSDQTPVGGGTITVELGDARLSNDPTLDSLRDGEGVRRGVVEVRDRGGRTTRVDLTDAVTLGDVVDRFADSNARVRVEQVGGRLTLADDSGGNGALRVRDVNGAAAADLGLLVDANVASVTGGDLGGVSGDTLLRDLNDGRGIANGPGDGLRVKLKNNATFDVDLSGAETVQDAIDRFQTASGGNAWLYLNGSRLVVEDNTNPPFFQPGNQTSVTGLNGSAAADDLGVAGTSATPISGRSLAASPGSVLLSSLDGGTGIKAGTIRVINAAGATTNLNLAGAADVDEVLRGINDAGAGVEARLNAAGNGIDLIDVSGGNGKLVVEDAGGGSFAADLGLAGEFWGKVSRGRDLDKAWLHGGTALADLNAGRGVNRGEVRVTDSAGGTATFDFAVGTFETVQDAIDEFNGGGLAITARVNDAGDGIVIEDDAGGTLVIEDVKGGTATDLRLAGTHDGGAADGSFEVSVDVADGESLEDVRQKLNELALPVRAEVLDTGVGERPYRLSVTGRESGRLAGFVFDARLGDGGDALLSDATGHARDAALLYGGGSGTAPPILVSSGTNSVEDLVPGLSLDLHKAGGAAATVTVEPDLSAAVDEVQGMVDAFNSLRESVDGATSFNPETFERGPLLGEPAVQRVERAVYGLIDRVYETGNPQYRILADVGVSVGDGATLELDADKFRAAWADDAAAVGRMFSETEVGFGFRLRDAVTALTDPVDGLITRVTESLGERTRAFEDRIARVEEQVEAKQRRLQRQFLDMELALGKLQGQQTALAAIPTFNYSPPAQQNG